MNLRLKAFLGFALSAVVAAIGPMLLPVKGYWLDARDVWLFLIVGAFGYLLLAKREEVRARCWVALAIGVPAIVGYFAAGFPHKALMYGAPLVVTCLLVFQDSKTANGHPD